LTSFATDEGLVKENKPTMKKAASLRNTLSLMFLATFNLVLSISHPVAAQTIKALPWVAEAPGEFVRLIDRGNVRIVVDDELVKKAGKQALTLFKFVVAYDFKYRHQALGYDRETNTWQSKIEAWMDQPKIKIEHEICLKSDFQLSSPWESKLLRHEFDHVAISSDPRMLKIMKRVLQQRREWTAKWVQPNSPSEQDIRKTILESITTEVNALEKLVQTQYDILDRESSQGTAELQGRTSFFKGLYSIEGIEKCKYTLTPSMREFVKQKVSSPSILKDVETHYLFLTP
jgi:hypothetical protein